MLTGKTSADFWDCVRAIRTNFISKASTKLISTHAMHSQATLVWNKIKQKHFVIVIVIGRTRRQHRHFDKSEWRKVGESFHPTQKTEMQRSRQEQAVHQQCAASCISCAVSFTACVKPSCARTFPVPINCSLLRNTRKVTTRSFGFSPVNILAGQLRVEWVCWIRRKAQQRHIRYALLCRIQ